MSTPTQGDAILNPFSVQTPEDLTAADALELFVDVFTDFNKVRDKGHSMLNGPRGCGKSMMFRFLQPDCQLLWSKLPLTDLPFFSVLVSVKNMSLGVTELKRFANQPANIILNEHLLTMFVASRTFLEVSKLSIANDTQNIAGTREVVAHVFKALTASGLQEKPLALDDSLTVVGIFDALKDVLDQQYHYVGRWIRSQAFGSGTTPNYSGPLCGYIDFLIPLFEKIKQLPFMPSSPIYLLIDDADYLNLAQTKVLNTWMASRTSGVASIKASTQLRYKTFQTVSGTLVESPHDYYSIDVIDIYTSNRGRYLERVREIISKRLKRAGIPKSPDDFFPPDVAQENEIRAIAEQIKAAWATEGRGNKPSDDVLRYARPTFIAALKGVRKSGSTYSYAGFEQLVHISSGLIRYFLEPAARMFSLEAAKAGITSVQSISAGIQTQVIREEADRLMFTEFDKIFNQEGEHTEDERAKAALLDRKQRLHNLIRVLGGIFHEKLISTDAERRIFSVAFSDAPDPDLLGLMRLGVEFGYFQRSYIGNKDGTGRTVLYVLTRRVAPHFNLDPTGFAGYLHMQSSRLKEAIKDPDGFLRRLKEHGSESAWEEIQLEMFS